MIKNNIHTYIDVKKSKTLRKNAKKSDFFF